MTPPLQLRFFRTIWSSYIMPKWKIFLWKLWHNSIATKDNLFRRGLGDNDICPICLYEVESLNHLFQMCPLASEAWDTHLGSAILNTDPHLEFQDWVMYHVLDFRDKEGLHSPTLARFLGTLWAIWITRNHQVFRQTCASLEGLHIQVDLVMKQHEVFSATTTMVDATFPTNDEIPPGFFLIDIGRLSSAQPQLIFRIDGSWMLVVTVEHALGLLPSLLLHAHSYQVIACEVERSLLLLPSN